MATRAYNAVLTIQPEFVLHEYDTPAEVFRAYFSLQDDFLLSTQAIECQSASTTEVHTFEDITDAIKEQRVWGFVQDCEIHFWRAQDVREEQLIEFLAHEVAHEVLRDIEFPYPTMEEMVMNACGSIARQALRLMKGVQDDAHQEHYGRD